MTALDARPAEGTVVTAPEPLLQGTFALFQEPGGAMVIAYRLSDGREGQKRIPKAMVKMGMRAAKKAAEQAGDDDDELPGLVPS
jgi:hypothetical protein